MTYPVNFGGLAAGNQPLSDFDTMFAVAGQQGNIPCTAAGTNSITLTPGTNYYVPSSYTNAQIASFKAVNTSTGSVTMQIGGLALVKLFTAAGVQAASGDVVNATHYEVQYWADLDSSAGGFIILNATVTAIANPVAGGFKNLSLNNNAGTPNTKVDMAADAVILQNTGGGTVRVTSVSLTCDCSTTGANGLDTGSLANSTFYSVWVIYNPTSVTTASLMSLSSTTPTLPAGYSYQARIGWFVTDSSAHFMRIIQKGRRAQYRVTAATNTTTYAAIVTGSNALTPTAITIVSVVIPTTAAEIIVTMITPSGATTAVGPTIAANANALIQSVNVSSQLTNLTTSFVVEANTMSYSANAAGCAVQCVGWIDNI